MRKLHRKLAQFPDHEVAACCHVSHPEGLRVRGDFRFQNDQNASLAETGLESDVDGSLGWSGERITQIEVGGEEFPDDGRPVQPDSLEGEPLTDKDNGDGTVPDSDTMYMWAKKTGSVRGGQ